MMATDRNTIAADLRSEVVNAIRFTAQHTGRSAQAAIGPSEIGNPCDRRIAYQVSGIQPITNPGDPLAAFLGTGGHAMLEDVFKTYQGQELPVGTTPGQPLPADLIAPYADNPRYLTETPVHPTSWLSGTCDLYDAYEDTVIDFKWVGAWSMNKYRKHGPSTTYRTQGHTYGLGWEKAGRTPKNVAIVFLPRETSIKNNVRCSLDYIWVWSEPYDRSIAERAITRVEGIRETVTELDVANLPELWEVFPATTGSCKLCPFHNPLAADLGQGCPGM